MKILPYHDRKEWIKIIADYRANYDQLKESLMVDPRESCNSPSINNPLSQQCEVPFMSDLMNIYYSLISEVKQNVAYVDL